MDYYNCLGYFKEEEDYEMLLLEKPKNEQICQEEGSNILSNFNYKGEKRPIYCVKHKEVYMINITYNICKKEDCKILANFNYEGEKIASSHTQPLHAHTAYSYTTHAHTTHTRHTHTQHTCNVCVLCVCVCTCVCTCVLLSVCVPFSVCVCAFMVVMPIPWRWWRYLRVCVYSWLCTLALAEMPRNT